MGKIRVALAEDNVLLREGISRLVAANEDFELVGAASDLPQLLALVGEQVPDVVVTDIRMPPTGTDEGIEAAAWIREHHPQVAVVVLSQYTAPGYALALLEQGSAGRGYLLKERIGSVDELARAIRTVSQGGSVIDPLVVDELVRARSQERHLGLSSLTPREAEIRGEAHQLDLRQAGAVRGEGRQPPGQGGAGLPQPAGRVVMPVGRLATPPCAWQHPRQHGQIVRGWKRDHPALRARRR
jgi:DNA-binding NarL/FixJ family response regulator